MKKVGLLALSAFGMASAAGSLWGPDADFFPSLQVQVPDVYNCWSNSTEPPQEGHQCYDKAGWWFAFAENGGSSVQLRKDGSFIPFVDGVDLTDPLGASLIGDGLNVKFYSGPAEDAEKPGLAAIGFNFYPDNSSSTENINGWGGYCITYSLTGSAVQLELGWNEATYNYDTWFVELTAATKKTQQLPWSAFDKDGWGTGAKDQPITSATNYAKALKIRLKNTGTAGKNAEFTLFELGKNGECSGGASIKSVSVGAGVNFNMVGRSFSLSSVEKPVVVQVINLQGAVVYSQTLTSASKTMNLSNLPTGVYMLRAPALGFTNKVILK